MPFQKWNVVANILTERNVIPACYSQSAICCDDIASECLTLLKLLSGSCTLRQRTMTSAQARAVARSSKWSSSWQKTSHRHLRSRPQFALLCLALIWAWECGRVLKLFKFTLKKVKWISSKVCLTLESFCMKNSPRLLWKLCKWNDWQAGVGVICRTNAQSDPKSL